MKYSKVSVGEVYIFDQLNTLKQMETGVNFVKVIGKSFFRVDVVPCNIFGESSDQPFKTGAEMLMPISENKADNIIIRYPLNSPVFTLDDASLLSEIAIFTVKNVEKTKLTEADCIHLTGLLQKVKFYAELNEKYKPRE